jgi:hypothetical protein
VAGWPLAEYNSEAKLAKLNVDARRDACLTTIYGRCERPSQGRGGRTCSVTVYTILKVERDDQDQAQFRYLGTTVTNRNLILVDIKRRLNSGNFCYRLVQNLLSSCLLSKCTN